MQHLGDITKINGYSVPIADCVVGGSPCQNLSVAGNREGLLGEESQLFHEQIRIVKEMRTNDRRNGKPNELISPRYMVWENVPGAFSSNKGEDFRTVLEEVARVIEEGITIPRPPKGKWATTGVIIGNGWSIAWRVCDAQYWGVPQRRRRICLVADFNGHTAPQIVFGENQHNGSTERGNSKSSIGYLGNESRSQVQSFGKGLSRNTDESGTEGQGTPTDAQGGFGASDIAFTMQERAGCEGGGKGALIQADRSAGLRTVNSQTLFQPIGCDIYNLTETGDKACSLTSQGYGSTGTCPKVIIPTYAIDMGGGKSSVDIHQDRSPTLTTTHYGEPAVVYSGNGNDYGDKSGCITGDHQNRITDFTSILVKPMVQGFFSKQAIGEYKESNEAHCLNARDYKEPTDLVVEREYGNGVVIKTVALEGNGQRPSHHGDGYLVSDKSYTLNGTEVHGVAYGINGDTAGTLDASYYKGCGMRGGIEREVIAQAVDCRNCTEDDTNGALQSNMAHSLNGNNVVRVKYIVRRLTPLECERLQGFPDGWTDIGEWVDSKGKVRQTSDAARYKALGNSIALPSWKWVIKRISAQYERDATMVSLFDGIGGFPHLWEQVNGKGSCLWASEIEDFPMAVTKKRIG